MGKYMSVKEMGDMLGIKKTDRYWLVKKGYFKVITAAGKMWVERESFETWYANQVKYHKVSGEEPGEEIRKDSLSPRDIENLLGIPNTTVYGIIKREKLETVMVDGWMRVPKEAFWKWYEGQDFYRILPRMEDSKKTRKTALSIPELAQVLGINIEKTYYLLRKSQYKELLPTVRIGREECVLKRNFAKFLKSQDIYWYHPWLDQSTEWFDEDRLLTIQQASWVAGTSKQLIMKWYSEERFPVRRVGNYVRISLVGLEKWLEKRKESDNGIDR